MTTKITLMDLDDRAKLESMPSLADMWERLGGDEDDLYNLVRGSLYMLGVPPAAYGTDERKKQLDTIVGLLIVAGEIGYFAAMAEDDELLGMHAEVKRRISGGEVC